MATIEPTFVVVRRYAFSGAAVPLTERSEGVVQTEGVAGGITENGARSSGAAQKSTKASMVTQK